MALRQKIDHVIYEAINYSAMQQRLFYSSKVDWKKLRPMILERIRNRSKDYPVKNMIPVAEDVIKAREILTQGVSSLLGVIPVRACKFCPEVYVGHIGHQIKTCHGFKKQGKNRAHHWTQARLNDILVPVESYHQTGTYQYHPITHAQRFDFPRIPAVLELCYQAGAQQRNPDSAETLTLTPESLSKEEISHLANETLDAWERVRLGVQKLLLVYPSRVCEHCREVHVGSTGHKARVCGIFRYERWRGAHFWKGADVDDFVPQRIVWHRRPHDPPVLCDSGREYFGHAPAIVEICMQAGARVPNKYFCMMKVHGLAPGK